MNNPQNLPQTIADATGLTLYSNSITHSGETGYFLGRNQTGPIICAWGGNHGLSGETAEISWQDETIPITLCPASPQNLAQLRRELSHLRPRPLGLAKSIGLGDRLGLATPGHVQAVRLGDMAPIFAQQSVRENARTGRSPLEVLDDATLGVFQEGWTAGFGADADHIKSTADLETFIAAGYSFYTFDAGDHVDDQAHAAGAAALQTGYQALPWPALESSPTDTRYRFTRIPFDLGDRQLAVSAPDLYKAAVKYGRAVAHTVTLARFLAANCPADSYEIEMSVDETEYPTSAVEHLYIAHELHRLGVKLTSLAPRYSGRFEKGVDFIGDEANFAAEFDLHLAIARHIGPYKLSLHSGSDKFTLYPIIARLASDGLIHVKTAGTSYLEALRTIAAVAPGLFRDILALAFDRYEQDRVSYHISAEKSQSPNPETLADDELVTLLDNFHTRQILHVTFGSILQSNTLKTSLLNTLQTHQSAYTQALLTHFKRHILPFGEATL
jgi:hypothetical protein